MRRDNLVELGQAVLAWASVKTASAVQQRHGWVTAASPVTERTIPWKARRVAITPPLPVTETRLPVQNRLSADDGTLDTIRQLCPTPVVRLAPPGRLRRRAHGPAEQAFR
jgi:hypothetical protein